MNRTNETCVQTIRLVLNTHGSSAACLEGQATRTTEILKLLKTFYNGWEITIRKSRLILETKDLDANSLVEFLRTHGIASDEVTLSMEYNRKWGML